MIGFIIAIAMAMAALRLAAAVVAFLVVGAVVWSAITRPKETLGWLMGFTLLGVVERAPLALCIPLALLVVVGWFEQRKAARGKE